MPRLEFNDDGSVPLVPAADPAIVSASSVHLRSDDKFNDPERSPNRISQHPTEFQDFSNWFRIIVKETSVYDSYQC